MSAWLKYAVAGSTMVALSLLALWPFLDPAGRSGVSAAAAVAVPVQVVAFAALHGLSGRLEGFLAAWVGGTLLRMVVLAAAAFFVIRSQAEGAVPMLLALAGFFFALLLLEPVYFRLGPSKAD